MRRERRDLRLGVEGAEVGFEFEFAEAVIVVVGPGWAQKSAGAVFLRGLRGFLIVAGGGVRRFLGSAGEWIVVSVLGAKRICGAGTEGGEFVVVVD